MEAPRNYPPSLRQFPERCGLHLEEYPCQACRNGKPVQYGRTWEQEKAAWAAAKAQYDRFPEFFDRIGDRMRRTEVPCDVCGEPKYEYTTTGNLNTPLVCPAGCTRERELPTLRDSSGNVMTYLAHTDARYVALKCQERTPL